MKKLELQKCIVGSVYTNCYFLKNKENGELLIVDPGDAADTIECKVSEMQGKPVGILLTHGHFDHIMAADEVRKKYNIPPIQGKANPACRCGDVLQGKCKPSDCKVFGKVCTPQHPVGACMVSNEGACSAYYAYGDNK